MKFLYIILLLFVVITTNAQAQIFDTLRTQKLNEVTIRGVREIKVIGRLPDMQRTFLSSGKKNEVIKLQEVDANIAEKTPRQIFARIPGVFVYDMDGTGNQMNISTRGLDPHRGWEFNIRKNGIITNSDMYGYPASHYSMPMEAVDRIELVRGTGSLQYGAQFGGMLNYVSKTPDSTRTVSFESISSIGSFGLLSTYNAMGGTIGKFSYYAYYSKRKSEGYRDNSQSDYDAQSVVLTYNASDNVRIIGEISRSRYLYQIPGPLTDSMFHADPRQSTRERSYFNPEIWVPSLQLECKLTDRTALLWTTSAVLGDRNSVQFDKPANVPDAIDPVMLTHQPRQVDIDNFNSYTSEVRLSHQYKLMKNFSTLAAGIQLMHNNLHRRGLGKGTAGNDFNLSVDEAGFGRDLHFRTRNIAFFAENRFQLTKQFSVSPGLRVERGESDMYGTISYYDPGNIPHTIKHRFPLFGVNAQFNLNNHQTCYAGWSQSYRPVIFKDIIPSSLYETVDKDLKDASGHNVEAGFRGASSSWQWDISLFQLQYNDRLGTQSTRDDQGTFYLHRTNIGNSVTRGVEIFVEYGVTVTDHLNLSVFTSTSLMRSRYKDAEVRFRENNINISGNRVESVPEVITRNGLTLRTSRASVTLLCSYTSETYADPLNTREPSATGAVGLVPTYGLLDLNSTWSLTDIIRVRLNINNVTDKKYFTKRPAFYPGPGVWPSDGRSVNVTMEVRI